MALTAEQQKMVSEMQAAENARMNSRLKDIGTGVLKGNTTDFINIAEMNPLLALITRKGSVDKPAGDEILENVTGTTVKGNAEEDFGSLFSFGGAVTKGAAVAAKLLGSAGVGGVMKAMVIPAKLSKTVDMEKAQSLIDLGVPNANIFHETGVYVDKDRQLKTVLSDAGARLIPSGVEKLRAGKSLKASELVQHDELYKLLPELGDITVQGIEGKSAVLGSYRTKSPINAESIFLKKDLGLMDLLSVFLHETQHGIQSKSGFAKGSNVDAQLDINPAEIQKAVTKGRQSDDPAVREAAERYKVIVNQKIAEAQNRYLNAPGEQEARFTQKAMLLDQPSITDKLFELLLGGDTPQTHDTRPIRPLPTKP